MLSEKCFVVFCVFSFPPDVYIGTELNCIDSLSLYSYFTIQSRGGMGKRFREKGLYLKGYVKTIFTVSLEQARVTQASSSVYETWVIQ